ncbi:MAG: DegT/DnrJ/EryC1/StrS family aminotransferase, partial [Lachnospiraceae bacterium]|nr:DegT/DnrJ/EryC1/StrS family aminotransferase [Lachnospiraceae bacterium]
MQFIDLHRQYDEFQDRMRQSIDVVLQHKQFINGPEVKELEQRLAACTGRKYVKSCANGTEALTISLMALGIRQNDAVFVPSFTFFASAESIVLAGGTPVFVDCREDTFNMSPDSLRKAVSVITEAGELRPKGVVAVDLFGQPAEYEEICTIAQENDLFVLEDGAQGFGGRIMDQKACSFGDISATSFYPAKPLGCYGDGGAIFTDRDDLAEAVDSIRNHGQGQDKYNNVRIGLNSRLDTIQAAVLLVKLDLFERELVLREQIARIYTEQLKNVIGVPVILDGYKSSWAQYTLKARSFEERKKILQALDQNGIPTAIFYPTPIHRTAAFKDH